MMNCREVTASADDYLEHRLTPLARLGMVLHLAMCKGCRTYVRQFALAVRGLRNLGISRGPHPVVDPRLVEEFRRTASFTDM